ncbi:MAG: MerR family transcriptional regulator [Bacteroidales bacterium]|jgi:DNA-binding transcriptional MerR regulator|nr:MerR family transcriptional regulator [Bacteroidales bacterium]
MKAIELSDTKLFYSIGEVATMFDVNTSLIRFWETEFDVIKPKKNAKGNRLFTAADVKNFQLIHYFVKEQGLTLKGAKKKLEENNEDAFLKINVIGKLEAIKEKLNNIAAKLPN